MPRLPIAIAQSLLALVVLGGPVRAAADAVGTINAFKVPEIDVYDGSGDFLCAVAPGVFKRAAASNPCAPAQAHAAESKTAPTAIPIKEVTDDGQYLVERGGAAYRLDPFQVDATMSEAPNVKSRCPKLAGRTEMAATRGLGESGCASAEEE